MESEISSLDRTLVVRALPHIHDALEHLLRAWDALHEAEKIVES
jgi:hypothetical protein